jgi:hypothetical protein
MKSDFVMYHSARNRLWTIIKNTPGWLLWVVVLLHIVFSAYLIFHLRKSSASALWKGLLAGIADLPAVWKQRRKIQAARVASIWDIVRAISWSITTMHRRDVVLRKW